MNLIFLAIITRYGLCLCFSWLKISLCDLVPADLAKYNFFLLKSFRRNRNNDRPLLDFWNFASAERTNVCPISDPSFDAFETVGMTAWVKNRLLIWFYVIQAYGASVALLSFAHLRKRLSVGGNLIYQVSLDVLCWLGLFWFFLVNFQFKFFLSKSFFAFSLQWLKSYFGNLIYQLLNWRFVGKYFRGVRGRLSRHCISLRVSAAWGHKFKFKIFN